MEITCFKVLQLHKKVMNKSNLNIFFHWQCLESQTVASVVFQHRVKLQLPDAVLITG